MQSFNHASLCLPPNTPANHRWLNTDLTERHLHEQYRTAGGTPKLQVIKDSVKTEQIQKNLWWGSSEERNKPIEGAGGAHFLAC